MHTIEEDEEDIELSKDLLSSKRSSSEDEQEQGLLGGWKERRHSGDGEKQPSKRPQWRFAVWCAIGGSIVFALIVSVGFVLGSNKRAHESVEAAFEIKTNDYVLDPSWDFSAPPQRREYSWTIRDQLHNPDGVYRPMILVNNQFPGPLVEVNEGDTIVVHVKNRGINATAIHWHGMYQTGTPHMDGTVGVSQCPIGPGQDFTYEFNVTGQSGTYWWHGHQGVQTSDGLNGPLVIHGRREKELQELPYDTDRVILLSDHYHELSSALLWQYLMPDMENTEPVPESGLVNGRAIRNCDDYPYRKCDNTTLNVGTPTVSLDRNKNHRLRLVNVGAFAEFQFQVDEHELAVTEVDGTDVHPLSYHRLNINPAQRYSVVLSSNITTRDNFWLRARMITKCFTDAPKTLNPDALAIVKYQDGVDEQPTSKDWEEQLAQECKDMNTTELRPVEHIAAPPEADEIFYFRSNFEIGAYRLSRGFFNSSSWRADVSSPTLHRSLDGLQSKNSNFSAPQTAARVNTAFINSEAFDVDRELVVHTTGVQTIDILVSNFDDGNHPLHLHGYKYFVLAQGHGSPALTDVGAAINKQSLTPLYKSLDLSNPLRRDTASVEAFGWILLRVITSNPGAWAFHCHVSWHAEAGLLMQFLTNTDELAKIQLPQANRGLCSAPGLENGMGPADEDYQQFAK